MANSQTITINVKAIADMKDVLTNVNSIQSALSKMKLPPDLKNSFNETFRGLEKEVAKYQELLSKKNLGKGDVSALEKSGEKISKLYDNIIQKMGSIDNKTLKAAFKDLGTEEVARLKQEISDLQTKFADVAKNSDFTKGLKDGFNTLKQDIGTTNEKATELVNKLGKTTFNTFFKNLESGRFDLATKNLESIKQQIDALEDTTQKTRLEEWFTKLSGGFEQLKSSGNIQGLTTQLTELKSKLTGSEAKFIQSLIDGFRNGTIQIEGTKTSLDNLLESQRRSTAEQANLNSELSQVKSRIQYFLGLNNAVNLFRRAVRSAFNTVKELDKAMTETAVVTDFTVGDMWNQLPRYTATANELGVTTKGAYETMTLFYQQGLDTNEAFALGTETMKMARIAGMEYTEATDAMTAALRGFNMELNETSAQRVNDVYSQLAAKTASNVEEISTAMTKTASIAHNAGMEFETTSAYLSQIIETTREAPETAGTALKTVIARFTELKKPLEEIGEVEGEVVDANKIETALKSVGVALRDAQGEFRNLDDVFLDLNERWDSLSKNQQRYVATMAAGSRQQSRFIAMMSDYGRTQELINEAYNSSGASQKQYEKTLDSLESKLNKLKNAWNEFLMGITDSNLIKGFVDMLTKLLNGLNKFSDLFGKSNGLVKTLMTLTAWSGLRKVLGQSNNGLLALLFGKKDTTKTFAKSLANIVEKVQKLRVSTTGLGLASAQAGTMAATGEAAASVGLTTIISQLATILVELAPIIAIAGTLVLVGVAVRQAWKQFSLKGQIIQAQELQDSFRNLASSAQDTKDSLQNVSNTYQELTEAINNATTAEERAAAIRDRNDFINKTLQENNEYTKFLESSIDINGQLNLTLNEEALAQAIVNAQESVSRATAGISFAAAAEAGLRAQQAERKYAGRNITLENGVAYEHFYDPDGIEIYARELTKKEAAAYTNYMTTEEQATAEMIQQATNGYLQMLEGKDIEGSVADGVAKVFARGFDRKEFSKATQIENPLWSSLFNVASPVVSSIFGNPFEQYAQELKDLGVYGSGFWKVQGTNYTKNEIDALAQARGIDVTGLDYKDRLQAIQSYDYNQGEEKRLNELIDLINSDKDLYTSILSGLSDVTEFTQNLGKTEGLDVSEILGVDAVDYRNALESIGLKTEQTFDELNDLIQQNIDLAREQQKQRLISTGTNLTKQGFVDSGFDLADWMNLDNTEYQDYVANILSNIENADFGAAVGNSILTGMRTLEDWDDSAVQQWINSIDFTNPIAAANALQQGMVSLDGNIRAVAESWSIVAEETGAFSKQEQVQYLLTSESFNNLNDQMDEFIKENGRLSADNIRELAQSCSELELLLDNGAISANGLANILNGMSASGMGILDINNGLIAAADSMNTLQNGVADTINTFNNFDPGINEDDLTGFISGAYDTLSGLIEKGAYGNSQIRSYLGFLFGPEALSDLDLDTYDDYGTAYEAKVNELVSLLNNNKENMYAAWSDFVKSIQGTEIAELFEDTGEEIIIHTSEGMTYDELLGYLTNEGQLPEMWAKAMIGDYENYSSNLLIELANNDVPAALNEWVEALPTDASGMKYYTADMEEAFRSMAIAAGASEDAINEAWEGLFPPKDSPAKKVALEGEDVASQMESLGYNLSRYTSSREFSGSTLTVIDGDKLKAEMTQAGLYTEEGFNEIISIATKGMTEFSVIMNGEIIEISKEAGEDGGDALVDGLTARAEQMSLDAYAEAMAESFTSALANVGELELDTQGAQDSLSEVSGAVDDVQKKVQKRTSLNVNTNQAYSNITLIRNRWDNWTPMAKTAVLTVREVGNAAKGGRTTSYASGTNRVKPGPALTGEEGPEIVWNKEKGYAYVTGSSHPEFQNLQPGDQIFNAQETKKILGSAARGGIVHSYSSAYSSAQKITSTGANSTAAATQKAVQKTADNTTKIIKQLGDWRGDEDWLYNLVEDIASLEHEQYKLQEIQNDYLESSVKNGKDLYNVFVQQAGNIKAQIIANEQLYSKRMQEIRDLMAANPYSDYFWYNFEDNSVEIDYDKFDDLINEKGYQNAKEERSRLEKLGSEVREIEKQTIGLRNDFENLADAWRDSYLDLENRVLDAIVSRQQDIIDNQQEINNDLKKANDKVLNSLQESINLSRQIRNNTETEEEISDIEARIAYLSRDTTGGNRAEILKLQKELDDKRRNYEDDLVDQSIERLRDDNDKAAEQRENQIEIMQDQLDYQKENGAFNSEILSLINGAMTADGVLNPNSSLIALLKDADTYTGLTGEGQKKWMETIASAIKSSYVYQRQLDETHGAGISLEDTTSTMGQAIQQVVDKALDTYKAIDKEGRTVTSSEGGTGSYSQNLSKKNVSSDYTGWVQSQGGNWSYFSEGEGQTGWVKYKGGWYYLDEAGVMQTGEVNVNGNSYYLQTQEGSTQGKMQTGWLKKDGNWYYYNQTAGSSAEGRMETGWVKYNGGWYYLNDQGVMQTGWVTVGGKDYYLNPTSSQDNPEGKMQTGWLYQGGSWYYFDSSGAKQTGWVKTNGTWYYLNQDGRMATGWVKDNGKIYFLNRSSGAMYTGTNTIDGASYTFNSSGALREDLLSEDQKKKLRSVVGYATGGLNTSTGLAWLDGTPSRPEYILSPDQTAAFLKLANVLPSIINGTSNSGGFGNLDLDITIHVDEVGSDYDVDKIANKIKDIIYNAGSYRNVNTLNFRH